MAEEVKSSNGKSGFSTFLKVILGLIFLALGGLAIYTWWPQLLDIIKGSIGLFLLLAGVITLAIAKE